jgi:hypothetical protein
VIAGVGMLLSDREADDLNDSAARKEVAGIFLNSQTATAFSGIRFNTFARLRAFIFRQLERCRRESLHI